jgi:hypothetical protein
MERTFDKTLVNQATNMLEERKRIAELLGISPGISRQDGVTKSLLPHEKEFSP